MKKFLYALALIGLVSGISIAKATAYQDTAVTEQKDEDATEEVDDAEDWEADNEDD